MRGLGNGRTDRKTNGRTLMIVKTQYYRYFLRVHIILFYKIQYKIVSELSLKSLDLIYYLLSICCQIEKFQKRLSK